VGYLSQAATAERDFDRLRQEPRRCDSASFRSQAGNLFDAASYATKLPRKEANTVEWQAAIEGLILVAELGGPTMFARICIMWALNRHVERVFDPTRKDEHWGRRKLARDR